MTFSYKAKSWNILPANSCDFYSFASATVGIHLTLSVVFYKDSFLSERLPEDGTPVTKHRKLMLVMSCILLGAFVDALIIRISMVWII